MPEIVAHSASASGARKRMIFSRHSRQSLSAESASLIGLISTGADTAELVHDVDHPSSYVT